MRAQFSIRVAALLITVAGQLAHAAHTAPINPKDDPNSNFQAKQVDQTVNGPACPLAKSPPVDRMAQTAAPGTSKSGTGDQGTALE